MGSPIANRAGWALLESTRPDTPRATALERRPHRDRTHLALGFLAVGVALALPVGLRAATLAPSGATFVVTSATDAVDANLGDPACATASGSCTLRAAVQQANALAGADTIQVPAGTYTLAIRPQNENLANTGDLDVTEQVTIVGASGAIIDGGTPTSSASEIRGLDRLFEIHAGAGDVSLVGLTIREGYSAEQGGAIYNSSTGRLRLANVRVLDSYAAKYGGGIANAGRGRVELVGSTVSGNGAKEGGSAIQNAVAGTVSITAGSEIVDNPGTSAAHYPITGGAINNEGEGDTIGTIEVLDSTVARNDASSNGAGIYNERDGRILVLRSTITENRTSASGAGIYSKSGTVLVREGSTISENHAGNLISSGSGGGIYNAGETSKAGTPGLLEIENATIAGNTATADGAGIFSGLDANLLVTDSTIAVNAAEGEGGGISSQSKADMTVTRVTFSGNSAGVAGGGAYAYAEGASRFSETVFRDNSAGETGGGGLFTDGSGSATVVGSTFEDNTSFGDGGGIAIHASGEQSISDSVIRDNTTDEGGGGVFNSGGLVTFSRLSIVGNSALLDGGGIKSEGSSQFTIVGTTLAGNSAENGGGFANAADGTMLLSSSTLSGNEARDLGGGLLNVSDAVGEVVNTTISGNNAGGRGGGLYTDADAELDVFNVTITDNSAPAGGGLATSVESINFPVVPATAVILRNTIVAGNTDGTNCHGAVFSQGGNLDQGTTCFFSDPRDLTRAGASLERLSDNGGGTPTHALRPSSVAIDRGVTPCPEADQRGVARPQNTACDIGAFEFVGTPAVPDSNPLPPPTGPDSEPPEVTIDVKPSIRTLDTFAQFRFRADELAHFECVLDQSTGASFSGCESPHDYTSLALGLHTFQVRAVDASSNVGPPQTYSWRVVLELDPPETSIASGPSELTNATGASVAFGADESATFECSLDGADYAACTSPLALTSLADGPHTLEVRATDVWFNVDESPAVRTWTVDATPPETAIDSGPEGLTNSATPLFLLSSSEAGATLQCRLDAGTFAACASPFTTPSLADGAHMLEVRASDAAGNVDATPASRAFTVDTVSPETSIDTGPPATTTSTTASFTFSASETGSSFACSLDGEAFADCVSPRQYTGLTVATHHVQVRSTDAAGNADGTPASYVWTVEAPDGSTPVITLTGPAAETNATTARFEFSASEPVTGFKCALDGATPSPCSSPVDLANLALGSHTFRVEATDLAGNTGAATHTWEVKVAPDTTAPVVTIAGPPASTPSTSTSFTFTANEPATFRCSLDSAPFAACTSPQSYSGLSLGQHVFRVEATDGAANLGITGFTWTVVDSSAPIVTISSGPVSPTTSTSAIFEFSANEPVTFHCSRDGAAFDVCSSPITYSGLAFGPHSFEVRATDPASNVGSASSVWTITSPQDTTAPVVTISSGPTSGTFATNATFQFSASEPSTFHCSLDGGALQTCSTGASYAGLATGSHTFQVQGRDAAGNVGSASWAWTISGSQQTCTPQTFTVAPNADSWLLQSSATSNYGQDSVVKVDTKSGANARALVRFPLPAITAGCTVQSAQLRLYAGSYKAGRTLLAVPVGSSWSESGVTWSNQPAATAAGVSAPSAAGFVTWNVASLVATSAGNFSFLISDASENGQGVEQGFHSREKGTDGPPRLVVIVG